MSSILEFAKNNYIILDIICGILIFALIGYAAERMSSRDIKIRKKKTKDTPIVNMNTEQSQPQSVEKL